MSIGGRKLPYTLNKHDKNKREGLRINGQVPIYMPTAFPNSTV